MGDPLPTCMPKDKIVRLGMERAKTNNTVESIIAQKSCQSDKLGLKFCQLKAHFNGMNKRKHALTTWLLLFLRSFVFSMIFCSKNYAESNQESPTKVALIPS